MEMGDGRVRRKTRKEGTGEAGVGAVDGEQRELWLKNTGELVIVGSEQPRNDFLLFFIILLFDFRGQDV